MLKKRILAFVAAIFAFVTPIAAFADQASFEAHVKFFQNLTAKLQAREDFLQAKVDSGNGPQGNLQARLANVQAHQTRLAAKFQAYLDKHPSR